MFHIWGGAPKIQSFPNFKSFHRISNFSQIQKSPKLPRGGGGGGRKNVDLFHFLWHFLIRRLPLLSSYVQKFPLPNPFFSLIEKCYNVPWVMKPNDKWTSRHTNQTTTRTTQKPLGDWDLIFKLGRWDWTSITSSLPLSTIYWLELPPSVTKDVIWAVTEINLDGVLKWHCVIILNL